MLLLEEFVSGDTGELIQNLETTADNYEAAWSIIQM